MHFTSCLFDLQYIFRSCLLNFICVFLHNLLERSFEDHWQKEEHFQTGPRRVHSSWKDRKCLHWMPFSCSSVCSWTQFAGKQNLLEMNDFSHMQLSFGGLNPVYYCMLFFEYILLSAFDFQSCLVAIVVPDAEILPSLAEKLGVKGSVEELCKNQVCTICLTKMNHLIFITPTIMDRWQNCILLQQYYWQILSGRFIKEVTWVKSSCNNLFLGLKLLSQLVPFQPSKNTKSKMICGVIHYT